MKETQQPDNVPYSTVEVAYWKRFTDYKRKHNQVQTEGLGVRIRKNVMPVFSAISRKYLLVFHRYSKNKLWNEQTDIKCIVPTITISRRELALLCECHENTITNNLKLLTATGLIYLQENTHGESYTLCPNHWILLGGDLVENPDFQALAAPPKHHTFKKDAQIFTSLNNLKILNSKKNTENEENVEKRQEGVEPKKQAWEENKGEKKEKGFDGAWNVFGKSTDLSTPGPASKDKQPANMPKPITEAEKVKMVENFWDYAKMRLYAKSSWTFYPSYEKEVKKVIYSDVFCFPQMAHQPESNTYLYWICKAGELNGLVDMMAAHHEKTGFTPYAATQFFSKQYAKRGGFLVTQKWASNQEKWRRQADADKLLQQAKEAMIRYRLPRGKRNITNAMQLYEWWIRKLATKTNAETVEAFQIFISTYNLYHTQA